MLVPVFMLDADLPVPAAREALAFVPAQTMLVVRRCALDGVGGLRWYALSRFELDVMLAGAAADQVLAAALDRYGHEPQPCAESDAVEVREGRFTGIVVRGGRPLGYAGPGVVVGAADRPTRGIDLESRPVPKAPGAPEAVPPARSGTTCRRPEPPRPAWRSGSAKSARPRPRTSPSSWRSRLAGGSSS